MDVGNKMANTSGREYFSFFPRSSIVPIDYYSKWESQFHSRVFIEVIDSSFGRRLLRYLFYSAFARFASISRGHRVFAEK